LKVQKNCCEATFSIRFAPRFPRQSGRNWPVRRATGGGADAVGGTVEGPDRKADAANRKAE